MCQDCASYFGEGACCDVSIGDVFLGREGTKTSYYARDRGGTIGGWCGDVSASWVRPDGQVRQRETRGGCSPSRFHARDPILRF